MYPGLDPKWTLLLFPIKFPFYLKEKKSMSACHDIFSNRISQNLKLVSEHLENCYGVNSHDIIPLISKYMEFSVDDHVGGFVPLYYQCGLPCRIWVCVTCKSHIRD